MPYGDGMVQWWLNLRWAVTTYAEALVKIELTMLIVGATVLSIVGVRGW